MVQFNHTPTIITKERDMIIAQQSHTVGATNDGWNSFNYSPIEGFKEAHLLAIDVRVHTIATYPTLDDIDTALLRAFIVGQEMEQQSCPHRLRGYSTNVSQSPGVTNEWSLHWDNPLKFLLTPRHND